MKRFTGKVVSAVCVMMFSLYSIAESDAVERIKAWNQVVDYQNKSSVYRAVSAKWIKTPGNETRSLSEFDKESGYTNPEIEGALKSALLVAKSNPKDDLGYMALDFLLRNSRSEEHQKQYWPTMLDLMTKHYVSDDRIGSSLLMLARIGLGNGGNPYGLAMQNFLESIVRENPSNSELRVRAAYYYAMESLRPINNLEKNPSWRESTREKSITFSEVAISEGRGLKGFGGDVSDEATLIKNTLQSLSVGSLLPDMSAKIVDGGEDKLSNYRGKVVLIDFWATWCVPCVASLPKVVKLKKELSDTPFEVITVSIDDSEEEVLDFIDERMELPFVNWHVGVGSEVQKNWSVHGVPYYFLLDESGVIQARGDFSGIEEKAKQLVKSVSSK